MGKNGKTIGARFFAGVYYHTIDDRGRVSVPADYRSKIKKEGDNIVVLVDGGRYVAGFTVEEWESQLKERFSQIPQIPTDPLLSKRDEDFQRYTMARTFLAMIDSHGRILIPPLLRESAHLRKEVVVVGMFKKFEIWDKGRWEREYERLAAVHRREE